MDTRRRTMRNVLILFTAAVMILSAAGFVMPQSAAAKSRTITVRCVCAGKVTFDVTAGGKKRANDVSSYSAKISKGTKWSVSDVRSSDPHVWIEIPVSSGRIGTKAQAVTIKTKLTAHNTSGVERIVKETTFEEDGSKALKCSICGQAGCRNTESERLFHEEAADARADDTGNR